MTEKLPPSVETVFLDAGNVLVSLDFERIRDELSRFGVEATLTQLLRAEAAARPRLSEALAGLGSTEAQSTFARYVELIVGALRTEPRLNGAEIRDLAARLKQDGRSDRIWCRPMEGVVPALERLRAAGLRLVVVSNADGTIRANLEARGFARYFDVIVDSSEVGYEKPDPRIFRSALALSGARVETTVHVGDMYHADVIGAREAGVAAILLDPFDDWEVDDCVKRPTLDATVDLLLSLGPADAIPRAR